MEYGQLILSQYLSGFFWVGGGATVLCLFKYGFHVSPF